MNNECGSPSSAKSTRNHRIRSPICCLRSNAVVEPESPIGEQRTPKSPYDEIRERCRRVKTRIKVSCRNSNNNCSYNCAHHQQHHHRRHHSQSYSGDFSYDPLSYALNFENDARAEADGSVPNFTARLPVSPVEKSTSPTVDLISF